MIPGYESANLPLFGEDRGVLAGVLVNRQVDTVFHYRVPERRLSRR